MSKRTVFRAERGRKSCFTRNEPLQARSHAGGRAFEPRSPHQKSRTRMYDVLKGDYAKPNGITENRLKKPIMQNHRLEIPNDGFVYPALLDVELNPRFCRGKKIMR